MARVWTLETGHWETPREVEHSWLGFLVLEGLLARDITLAGSTSTELVGEGDVLQPWLRNSVVRRRGSVSSATELRGTCSCQCALRSSTIASAARLRPGRR